MKKRYLFFSLLILSVMTVTSCKDKNKKNTTKHKDELAVLFWNVDTQIDFVEPNGKLYVEGAELKKPIWKEITAFAKKRDIKVVNTCDSHNHESKEISDKPDFNVTFPPHCMENTEGAKYVSETTPEEPKVFRWDTSYNIDKKMLENRNIVITKDAFDAFIGSPHTNKIVSLLNPKKVFVYGVATNVCVDRAVIGLAERGYKVYVIEDAIKELKNIPLPFDTWKKAGVTFIPFDKIKSEI